MPIFDPASPPLLPGFYSIVKATADAAVTGGSGGIVMIPITHDWGPEGIIEEIRSSQDWKNFYGPTIDDNSLAVLGALEGDGTPNGGASVVKVFRIAPTTPNGRATKALSNGTVTGITLNALYKGTYGNSLRVTVRDHPVTAGVDQLIVTDVNTGSLLESYDYIETDMNDLTNQINASGKNISAVVGTTGTALTSVSAQALTGGTNASIILGDWTSAMSSIENEDFDIVVFPNMTDTSVLAAARVWVQNTNDNIQRIFMFTGGAANELVSAGNTRSALSNTNENIANNVTSTFIDNVAGVTYSGAQMVGFTAGIAAGMGVTRSMTYGRYPARFSLTSKPSLDSLKTAVAGGSLICGEDRRGVYIQKGVTTFNVNNLTDKPKSVFSRILNVRVIHRIDKDLNDLVKTNFIGGVKNTPTNRATFIAETGDYFKGLEKAEVLDAGSSNIGFDDTQDNNGEVLHVSWNSSITKSIEQVLSIGIVS